MHCDRARDLLGAYRDDELPSEERYAVEGHLSSCRSCSETLADDGRIGRALQQQGRVPASSALAARIRASLDRAEIDDETRAPAGWQISFPQAAGRVARRAAALAAACILSVIATWWVISATGQTDRIELEVLNAHIRSLLQDTPVQVASSDQHAVRPWFAGRTDFSPAVKDLTAEGFPLIGGRVDYVMDRRVGVVVYKRRLHTINVFMWPSAATPDKAPHVATRKGYVLLSWSSNGVAYWAVSDLNAGEMRELQRLL